MPLVALSTNSLLCLRPAVLPYRLMSCVMLIMNTDDSMHNQHDARHETIRQDCSRARDSMRFGGDPRILFTDDVVFFFFYVGLGWFVFRSEFSLGRMKH